MTRTSESADDRAEQSPPVTCQSRSRPPGLYRDSVASCQQECDQKAGPGHHRLFKIRFLKVQVAEAAFIIKFEAHRDPP